MLAIRCKEWSEANGLASLALRTKIACGPLLALPLAISTMTAKAAPKMAERTGVELPPLPEALGSHFAVRSIRVDARSS
jgi:hypothetical protein